MPYDLLRIDNDALISVRFFGKSSRKEHQEARSTAAELCQDTGFRRVIVDMTKEVSFMSSSTLDLFEFGKEFTMGEFPRDVRIAVVNQNGPNPDLEFVVTVAWNRGFSMELFNDVGEARRWLQR